MLSLNLARRADESSASHFGAGSYQGVSFESLKGLCPADWLDSQTMDNGPGVSRVQTLRVQNRLRLHRT